LECIFTTGLNLAMQDVWNKTYYPKADDHKNVEKKWYIVDAADKRLGRLASTIAIHIRGKNMASFTPSIDMGAYVIVVHDISLHYPMMCPMIVAN
jgi:large subunit ribosomal protein L13